MSCDQKYILLFFVFCFAFSRPIFQSFQKSSKSENMQPHFSNFLEKVTPVIVNQATIFETLSSEIFSLA